MCLSNVSLQMLWPHPSDYSFRRHWLICFVFLSRYVRNHLDQRRQCTWQMGVIDSTRKVKFRHIMDKKRWVKNLRHQNTPNMESVQNHKRGAKGTMYMGVIDVTPKSALTRRLQLERHNKILSWALRLQIQGGSSFPHLHHHILLVLILCPWKYSGNLLMHGGRIFEYVLKTKSTEP